MRNIDIYPQDKIYSDLVGVWYPAASAGADDEPPVPPVPPVESKVNFGGVKFQYIGNAPTGAKEAWSCDIKLDFIEQEPDLWYATVRFNDYVYESENDYSDPHPTENVDIQFGTQEYKPSEWNGLYGSYNPVWVIGGTPTSAVITIYVDGEVWTTATTNVIKIQENEPEYLEGLLYIEKKGENKFDFNFEVTTQDFNFNNLESGWLGKLGFSGEITPGNYGDVELCNFNSNNIISNTKVAATNQTSNFIPVNGIYGGYVSITDDSGLLTLYNFTGYVLPEPSYIQSDKTLTRKSIDGFDFEFEVTTQDFNFNNLESGWYGEVIYNNSVLCSFNSTNVTSDTTVKIENQTATIWPGGIWCSIKIYDSNNKYKVLYKDNGSEATVITVLDTNYFYLENQVNNSNAIKITKTGNPSTGYDLQYSTNGFEWSNVTFGSNINFEYGIGKRIYLRSTTGFSQDASNYYKISYSASNKYFSAGGDIRTLIDYTNMTNTAQSYAFYNMFDSCSALNGVSSDLLSNITVLNNNCYERMFRYCSNLTNLPTLPSTTLASQCYKEMFYGCSKINLSGFSLPATVMTANCYEGMFRSCTNLTQTIPMSASTLASGCFKDMYRSCSKISTPLNLNPLTLTNNCYEGMFYGCSNLTYARIYATTLAEDALDSMFYGCSKLNTIVTETSEWDESYATTWVQNVAATGTFNNSGNATIPVGVNGIPSGWTEVRNNQ